MLFTIIGAFAFMLIVVVIGLMTAPHECPECFRIVKRGMVCLCGWRE